MGDGMAASTEGERLARLEGAYEHLATKADVERLRTEMIDGLAGVRADIESVRSELRGMKWIIGAGIAAAGAIGPVLERLLG
jgi:hypothetical protein